MLVSAELCVRVCVRTVPCDSEWVCSLTMYVDIRYPVFFHYCIGKNIYFVLLCLQSAGARQTALSDSSISGCARVFVSKCECVYLYECECLLSAWLTWYSVCLVSLLIYYGRIWVALSYYFLHFSACLMFAVVVVVVLVDAVIILCCVCLCEWLSDCARVCVRNNWNSTTVIVCLCLIKNYRWIRSDLSKKHSSVALMVLLCRFLRLLWKLKSYSIAYSKN